jgi:ribosome-associated heat shock protein Hsp15
MGHGSPAAPLTPSWIWPRPDASCQHDRIETTRIDQWLWAVRLHKTRSAATAACRVGRVRVNGVTAKAASPVHPGDRVEIRAADRSRIVEVVKLISKRVGAPVAAECLIDHTPPPPPRESVVPVLSREPGSGRPTKRDRRNLDKLRRQ